jgi:hypothetical protein
MPNTSLADPIRFLADAGVVSSSGFVTATQPTVTAKAANYTINPLVDKPGTIFTNYGASGAVNFTLPAPVAALAGYVYDFLSVVDQNILVVAGTADTLIAIDDVAADSLAASTTDQKIAAYLRAICVQTGASTYQWVAVTLNNGITGTVATA